MNVEKELQKVENELEEISKQLEALLERQNKLEEKKAMLESQITNRKEKLLDSTDWSSKTFQWSDLLFEKMKSVFGIEKLRDLQHQTMNVTLSKEDCILIMPTGGGKSLCYQLPAVISKGVTLVVSPLVSLMEDQLMALTRLRVQARMFSSSAGVKETNALLKSPFFENLLCFYFTPTAKNLNKFEDVLKMGHVVDECSFANNNKQIAVTDSREMIDSSSPMKLLYVTPEKVAKSKRFMANLEKMYTMGRLERIAIDEVHCCSQWGHDFRPDYKFLGIMKRQFPGVPLLGLTATSTTSVTHDVQKMLNIPGCFVLRASFNRPNLNYMVLPKPSNAKEALDTLAEMIKRKYKNDSGIIYCCSIKDCEDIAKELRARNIKAGTYHATLEPAARSKAHQAWASNEIKLVVATIAFGMGIDKPDVRYVIHHSISKSMENYYQESGRAGRDDQPSDCVIFYRFNDIFRQSTMVFTEQTGLDNLHAVIAYCIDGHRCRRSLIATHFGEEWTPEHCKEMCDHCRSPASQVVKKDITKYCLNLYTILDEASRKAEKQNLTGMKLVEAWMGKGPTNHRVKSVPVPNFSRELCERIVAHLIIEGFLREDFHFTPYATLSYIVPGSRASLVKSGKLRVELETAQPASKTMASATISKSSSTVSTPKSLSSSTSSPLQKSSSTKSTNNHQASVSMGKEKSTVKANSSEYEKISLVEKKKVTTKTNISSGDHKDEAPVKRKVVVVNSSDSDSDFDPLFSEPKKKKLKSTNNIIVLD